MVEYLKVYCKPRLGEASALAVYSGGDIYNVFRAGGQALGMNGAEIQEMFTLVGGKSIQGELFKIQGGGRLPLKDRYPYDLQAYYWIQQGSWVVHGTAMNNTEFRRLFEIIPSGKVQEMPEIRIDENVFTLLLSYFDGDHLNITHVSKFPSSWSIRKDGMEINLVDGNSLKGMLGIYRSVVGEDHVMGILMVRGQEFVF